MQSYRMTYALWGGGGGGCSISSMLWKLKERRGMGVPACHAPGCAASKPLQASHFIKNTPTMELNICHEKTTCSQQHAFLTKMTSKHLTLLA